MTISLILLVLSILFFVGSTVLFHFARLKAGLLLLVLSVITGFVRQAYLDSMLLM